MEYIVPIVEVEQGKLQGEASTDFDGKTFLKFLGIPYAKPPIGDLRFKVLLCDLAVQGYTRVQNQVRNFPSLMVSASGERLVQWYHGEPGFVPLCTLQRPSHTTATIEAQPPEPWSGIRDATRNGDPCIQQDDFKPGALIGSEDCLYLNIFTKEPPSSNSKLKPVIVYIHGGGFTAGSNNATMLGPEYLITEDIVLVSINYRLGILGFLSADDPSLNIPGNNGLKDQTAALQWVQKNILKFSGNPENVTIMGCSAGAAAVHFHVLSPLSKGLFHKAVLQSGCALNPWAWGTKGNAIIVAEILGNNVSNEKEAVEILKRTPVRELYDAQLKLKDTVMPSAKRLFCPVIEKSSKTAFLTKDPLELLLTGEYNQVPLIFGYTDNEGILIDFPGINFDKSIEHAIPRQWHIRPGSKEYKQIIEQFRSFYNGSDENDSYMLFSDSLFVAQIADSIKMHMKSGTNPLYLYRFTLDTHVGLMKALLNIGHIKGVSHADDLAYLFKNRMVPEHNRVTPGGLEEKAMRRYVKLMTNFAKTCNPTPPNNDLNITWPSVTSDENFEYLDIGEELIPKVNPDSDRMELWKDLSNKHPSLFSK